MARSLKQISLASLFVLITLLLLSCQQKPDGQLANGESIYLSQYRGQWVIVNYWAQWCKPCLTELPELNTLFLQHNKSVMVLGVSFDPLSAAEMAAFAKKLAINFPLLTSFNLPKFGIQTVATLPMTIVISPKGKLVKVLSGPQTQASLLQVIKLG